MAKYDKEQVINNSIGLSSNATNTWALVPEPKPPKILNETLPTKRENTRLKTRPTKKIETKKI